MKRLVLTDSLIRDALAPDPHVVAPAGLLAQVTADVARTPQRRTLGFPGLPQSRRLAWAALGAATLLVLLGTLLLAGGGRNPLEGEMLLPPAPSPTSSPLPQRLWVGSPAVGTEIVGLSADEAWATYGNQLWHRTAAGWFGPMSVNEDTADGVRGLDRIADGRIVVAADSGIYVGSEAGWTQIWRSNDQSGELTNGVAVDAAGTIWAPGIAGTSSGLRSFREVDGTWRNEYAGCPAGGLLAASAADGSVWTAGIDYSGTSGVARLGGGACTQLFPFGDDRKHDVVGITADGQGRVAVQIMDTTLVNDLWTGGRLAVWDNGQWTTLHQGETFRNNAWNALSYAPDGSLWVAFDGKLWRYDGTTGTPIRDAVPAAVSVAPDGTVWFVTKDAEGDGGEIDRLLPGDVAPATSAEADATTGPSAVPELDAGEFARLLGLDDERAWIAKGDENAAYELWSRTAGGWHGPMTIDGVGLVRGLADLGDDRIAVASDNGAWVGNAAGWTKIWDEQANAVEMDRNGTLWVAGLGNRGTSSLRSFRETADGWSLTWSGCRAGGWSLDVASDGSAWTTGVDYSGTAGLARVHDGACEAITSVAGLDTTNVEKLAAGPPGRVAAVVLGVQGTSLSYAHLVEWDGERWAHLESGDETVAGRFGGIGYASDGALWAVIEGRLSRFADGAWTPVADATRDSPISPAHGGAVWYIGRDGAVAHTEPLEFGPGFQRDGQFPTDFDGWMAVVAPITEGEQWLVAPGSGQGLVAWHRTPSGWTGPFVVESQRANTGYPRAIVPLPDGRFAVSAEGGLWVGREGEWTRLRDQDAAGIAVANDGTLWFGARDKPGLLSMRETSDGWQPGPTSCAAGGGIVAAGRDGTVWSAPSVPSQSRVVHVVDGRCEALVPDGGATSETLALGPDLEGGVAAVLSTRVDGVERTRIVHWDGRRWTTLRDVAGSTGNAVLAYAADGTLWMVWNQALARYADGAWADLTGAANGFLATAPDGTIWFYDEREGYRPVDSLEVPNP